MKDSINVRSIDNGFTKECTYRISKIDPSNRSDSLSQLCIIVLFFSIDRVMNLNSPRIEKTLSHRLFMVESRLPRVGDKLRNCYTRSCHDDGAKKRGGSLEMRHT